MDDRPWPWLRDDLDLNKSQTFIYSISCLYLPLFKSQAAIVFKKSIVFTFSHVSKIGQGHPRCIILSNYDGLEPPMLHTKFRGNRPIGSGQEIFLSGFYHIWAWRPSWSKKKIFEIIDDDGRTTDTRAPNSAVHGQISWNSELNRDLTAVLVTWKNEEDMFKNNKVNAWAPFSHYKSMGIFQTLKGR